MRTFPTALFPQKKAVLSCILFFFSILSAWALTIPQGTFYFNNSLTNYANVKFVFGYDSRSETHVLSMTDCGNGFWSITLDQAYADAYRYTFAATSLPDGLIESTFSTVKDDISNNRGEYRTATTDAIIPLGYVYTPSSSDNWAQGSWLSRDANPSQPWSGKLPVLFINTGSVDVNQQPQQQYTYVSGTWYLDNMGLEGIESFGTETEPLTLEIKGRGNYTWGGFEKKPYRIKLTDKQPLLGMKKSKHFALLAHADDNNVFLRNTVGFMLSKAIGLAYTPNQQPVELVLNGDYRGLYMLTENIRVDKDRVNITEQADESDADVTGGWLIEIDNYQSDGQVQTTEGNGADLWITPKSPEVLSAAQRTYLSSQIEAIDQAIYDPDKNSTLWQQLIDIDALVRYYIVQEMLDDAESFHGSCYIHKDAGDAQKWTFGPVWDFGNSFRRSSGKFCYQDPPFGQTWIAELALFPAFQDHVRNVWRQTQAANYAQIPSQIDNFVAQIADAAICDANRWSAYAYGTSDPQASKREFQQLLADRIAWLTEQWGQPNAIQSPVAPNSNISNIEVYTLSGAKVATLSSASRLSQLHLTPGAYVVVTYSTNDRTSKVLIIK